MRDDDEMLTAADAIRLLELVPHFENGFYKETYRCDLEMPLNVIPSVYLNGNVGPPTRSVCTAIYYLVEVGSCDRLHRVRWDELWHFYYGDPFHLVVVTLEPNRYAPFQPRTTASVEIPATHPDLHGHRTYAIMIFTLGNQIKKGHYFQMLMKAGDWFGGVPCSSACDVNHKHDQQHRWHGYSLMSCTVAPGFDVSDYEPADHDAWKPFLASLDLPSLKSFFDKIIPI